MVVLQAISPLLIVVRVGMGKSYNYTTEQTTAGPGHAHTSTSLRFSFPGKQTRTGHTDNTGTTLGNTSMGTQDVELGQYNGKSEGSLKGEQDPERAEFWRSV